MKNRKTIENEFRAVGLFTKDDVLASFKSYMEYLEAGEKREAPGSLKAGNSGVAPSRIALRRIDLCAEFLRKLEACALPVLTELWWFYEYLIAGDRIELSLCTATDVTLDKKGNLSWSTSVERTIVKQECGLLTVEEFAQNWDVKPTTVRQWIRRGKLRTARKIGKDWFIPELQDKPERGFKTAYYLISQSDLIKIPGFPLVSVCDSLTIVQDKADKKSFVVSLRNNQSGFRQNITLTQKEVESLEFALISSGKTTQSSYAQLIPRL